MSQTERAVPREPQTPAKFAGYISTFFRSIDRSYADDSAAIEPPKRLIEGYDLELWQRDRRIARFDGKPPRPYPTEAALTSSLEIVRVSRGRNGQEMVSGDSGFTASRNPNACNKLTTVANLGTWGGAKAR
jgi:hypothetical protein